MSNHASPVRWLLWFVVSASITVRIAVSFGSYSGANSPPLFGDYEAQRHWMELTTQLPIHEWHVFWTARLCYFWDQLVFNQSWLYGKVVEVYEPEAVELIHSHGYETPSSKLLLRWSVILSDVLVFFPAVWCLSSTEQLLAVFLLQPCLVLADHGHFQYNCISLGFVLKSIHCIITDQHLLGSALFIASINHKHMSLYFAPAFFGYLFGKCLQQRTLLNKVMHFCRLGAVVIGSMCFLWLPFLSSMESALQVLQALTPVDRGIYEDYVSNFWCATSVLFKWKRRYTKHTLLPLCLAMTVIGCLPSMLHQIASPSKIGFRYSLVNASLSFYLFAYQVHEKSILIPALAMCLLLPYEPFLVVYFQTVAAFSMFPLFEKDGLSLQYCAMQLLFLALPIDTGSSKPVEHGIARLSLMICSGLHLFRVAVNPPDRFPYMHDLLFSMFSFCAFFLSGVYVNCRQWKLKQ